MNETMVIATRELRERSRLFLMCAVLATLPFMAALLPAAKLDRPMVIAAVAGFLALVVSIGTAGAFGVSTISGELAERRLSFYFTRPVPSSAIWFGKAIGAVVTSLACFVIIAVPAWLATGPRWTMTWVNPWRLLLIVAIGVVTMFLINHTLTTLVRSRSPWIAVDFALAAIASAVVYLLVHRVQSGGSVETIKVLGVSAAVALGLIFAVAPVWQLANGRTDVRRSHLALSRALWSGVAVLLVIASGVVWWIVSFGPAELATIHDLAQSPSGNVVMVSGVGRGRGDFASSFLVDAKDGRSSRLESPVWWGADFSRDGKTMAWLQPDTGVKPASRLEVYTRRLDDIAARSVATGIRPVGRVTFALSHDGSRVAVSDNNLVAIYDVASGRVLASARASLSYDRRMMYFVSPDTVRVLDYRPRNDGVRISELDARTRQYTQTGMAQGKTAPATLSASPDGSRLLMRHAGVIVDGRTGAPLETVAHKPVNPFAAALLHDGTPAVIARENKALVLHTTRGAVALPGLDRANIAAQLGDGKLVIGGSAGETRSALVVDLERGVVERTIEGLSVRPRWFDAALPRFGADQQLAAIDAEGKAVVFDPRTGTIRPLTRS